MGGTDGAGVGAGSGSPVGAAEQPQARAHAATASAPSSPTTAQRAGSAETHAQSLLGSFLLCHVGESAQDTDHHVGAGVGAGAGTAVGSAVGTGDGSGDGAGVGAYPRANGLRCFHTRRTPAGADVGAADGAAVVGVADGADVGVGDGGGDDDTSTA